MQATVAKHSNKSDLPPILVTLGAAPDSIGMRISDQGTVHHTTTLSIDSQDQAVVS